MSRCLSRIPYETEKLPFGDGKHYFYLEVQCDRICEESLCNKCSLRCAKNTKDSKYIDHGQVNGPYTEKSHIFGGPWYIKMAKAYGSPTQEVLEKAMEAQSKARNSNGKIKVVRNVSSPKKIVVDTGIMILPLNKMVESNDEPLEVDSVVRIVLKSIVINEEKFWLSSDKLYKMMPNGNKGVYVGRWDGSAICDIADSDDE